MGREEYCDLCGAVMPIADQLKEVKIGELTVAEICLNCRNTLSGSINNTKRQIAQSRATAGLVSGGEKKDAAAGKEEGRKENEQATDENKQEEV